MLRSKLKRLHELGNIAKLYISGGTKKGKITKNSSPKAIPRSISLRLDLLPTWL